MTGDGRHRRRIQLPRGKVVSMFAVQALDQQRSHTCRGAMNPKMVGRKSKARIYPETQEITSSVTCEAWRAADEESDQSKSHGSRPAELTQPHRLQSTNGRNTEMVDVELGDYTTAVTLRSATRLSPSLRWRTSTDKSANNNVKSSGVKTSEEKVMTSDKEADEDDGSDVDIESIRRRTYLMMAGIGDTNRTYNKYKGWIGLVIWCLNFIIHFGLDFYEAVFVFHVSWATCIGLFLIALSVGCYSMIKHSVPWFIKAIRKLKRDGHYPKTLRRVRMIFRFLPFAVPVFAVGAAMGQFGCYAYDGALRLSFTSISNKTGFTVPPEIDVLVNVLRAVSLTHVFYGFCLQLLFHLTVIFMIQSSMDEFNDRMGKVFRETPVCIAFPEAVNLFSTRARFVREGSSKCAIVLTTLLVACSTSFVLNAYNFLFLKRFAIYVWFALAPQLWTICPLVSAGWTTKTYNKFKLVVVNAWVDIPEEHEIEAQAHEDHVQNKAANQRTTSPARRMWGSVLNRTGKNQKAQEMTCGPSKEKKDGDADDAKHDAPNRNQKAQEMTCGPSKEKKDGGDADDAKHDAPNRNRTRNGSVRENSEISLHLDAEERRRSKIINPTIYLTNCEECSPLHEDTVKPRDEVRRRNSDPYLTKVETDKNVFDSRRSLPSLYPVGVNISEEATPPGLCRIDVESSYEDVLVSKSCESSPTEDPSQGIEQGASNSGTNARPSPESQEISSGRSPLLSSYPAGSTASKWSLAQKQSQTVRDPPSKSNFLSGMAKTFNRWRTKTKKKRKFNYEKYITYLESILPTVGFSIGGVIITYNGIYTFIAIMTFLVGVFAQEAFFGN